MEVGIQSLLETYHLMGLMFEGAVTRVSSILPKVL